MDQKISIIVVALLIVAGIYWAYRQNIGDMVGNNVPTNTTTPNIVIKGPIGIAAVTSGDYLTDLGGLTLYVNIKDEGQTESIKTYCDAACERTWLPYLFDEGRPAITESSDAVLSKINVFTRTDGQQQYALGTKPLYRNANDLRVGDINGDVNTDWMVARP